MSAVRMSVHAHRVGEPARADHAADRTRVEEVKRPALGLLGLERSAERLAEVDAALEAGIRSAGVELLDVARDRLADERVQARRDHALVLAHHGIELGGDAEEQVRELLS